MKVLIEYDIDPKEQGVTESFGLDTGELAVIMAEVVKASMAYGTFVEAFSDLVAAGRVDGRHLMAMTTFTK